MIDPRFYHLKGPVLAQDLARGARLKGDPRRGIRGLASLERAGPEDLAYFDGKGAPPPTQAGCLIVRDAVLDKLELETTLIGTPHPRAHFASVASEIAEERAFASEAPRIASDALLEEGVRLAPGVVIGPGAQIGRGSHVGANTVIGPGVAIGRECRIGPLVSIQCALIGDRVTLLSGVLVGQSGFGVAVGAQGPMDVPHFGRAILQDDVSVGAGSTIDRGLFDDTVLAEGAKIDNLCQIAHNCVIGRGAVIAAFGGISGSTIVGDGAMMGGRVGIADHRKIGRGAQLAAGSAVMHDVPDGETWAGYPAKPIRQWLRETAWLNRAIGKRDGSDT